MNVQLLGERIATIRRKRKLTQDELSDRAGVSYSTISKLERGEIKNPSLFTMFAIANVCEVSLDELMLDVSSDAATEVKFIYSDMNGVLVRFFQRAFVSLSRELDIPADKIEAAYWHFNDGGNRGNITIAELNTGMQKHLKCTRKIDWKRHYLHAVEPIKAMQNCLKDLQTQGYKIGLLTNTMPELIDDMQKLGIMPKLTYDAVIDSSQVHSIKPQSKIFDIAEQQAGVAPEQILFIDDTRANLVAAERRGWNVIWFDDYRPLKSVKKIYAVLEN